MSTLVEIEAAVQGLTPVEKERLLISIAQILRAEGREFPPPRRFTSEEMTVWLDEDEREIQKSTENDLKLVEHPTDVEGSPI
jgi:hypothetical protein